MSGGSLKHCATKNKRRKKMKKQERIRREGL
jgi:hypothetical protein